MVDGVAPGMTIINYKKYDLCFTATHTVPLSLTRITCQELASGSSRLGYPRMRIARPRFSAWHFISIVMKLKYSKHVFQISENFTCEVYFTYDDDIVSVTYYEVGMPVLCHTCKKDRLLTVQDYARKYLKEFYQKLHSHAL